MGKEETYVRPHKRKNPKSPGKHYVEGHTRRISEKKRDTPDNSFEKSNEPERIMKRDIEDNDLEISWGMEVVGEPDEEEIEQMTQEELDYYCHQPVVRLQTMSDPSVGIYAIPLSPSFMDKNELVEWWQENRESILTMLEEERYDDIEDYISRGKGGSRNSGFDEVQKEMNKIGSGFMNGENSKVEEGLMNLADKGVLKKKDSEYLIDVYHDDKDKFRNQYNKMKRQIETQRQKEEVKDSVEMVGVL